MFVGLYLSIILGCLSGMKLVCCQMNFVVICVKDLRCSRAIESCGHERQLVTRRTCSTWHKLTRKSQMLRELISSLIMSLGRRSFPENQLQDHGSTQRLVVKFACRERDSETVVTRDSVPNREHYASLNQLCLKLRLYASVSEQIHSQLSCSED